MKNNLKRGSAMREVLLKLKQNNINLKNMSAIEIFGGKGNWHLQEYSNKVKSLEIWEIRSDFKDALKNAFPMAKVKILDSVKHIRSQKIKNFYDLIVIDNPQGVFGQNNVYCEHFDVLEHINKIISRECVVILNVNINPFNYDTKNKWKTRREKFYGINFTEKIDMEFLYNFYLNYMEEKGLKIEKIFSVSRFKDHISKVDYLHYLVLKIVIK